MKRSKIGLCVLCCLAVLGFLALGFARRAHADGGQLTPGGLTRVVVDSPLTGSGTSSSHAGWIACGSTNQTWVWNGSAYVCTTVGSGTVTSIVAGAGLSGGTITTTGTISMPNVGPGVSSHTYASITLDVQGRVTAASSGAAPALAATTITAGTMLSGGGDLSANRTINLADIATSTVIGRVAAGTGAPSALTTTQLTTLVNPFSSTLSGAVPASGGSASQYLNGAGGFTTPPGTGVTGTGTTNTTVKYTNGAGGVIGNAWPTDDATTWGVTGKFTIFEATGDTIIGATGRGVLQLGGDPNLSTNAQNGLLYTVFSDGNNYVDSKTNSGGTTTYRVGAGAQAGSSTIYETVANSSGAVTWAAAQTITAGTPGLNISNATQATERLRFSGQEYLAAGHTSTDGMTILLGVQRLGNRALWLADSAQLASNATNTTLQFGVTASGGGGTIDTVATDTTTPLPLAINPTHGAVSIGGQLDMTTHKIINVTDPTSLSSQEAATSNFITNNSLSTFNASHQGTVAASGGGTAKFLRADDTWIAAVTAGGAGTSGRSTRFTGTDTIGNGALVDDGTNATIGGGGGTQLTAFDVFGSAAAQTTAALTDAGSKSGMLFVGDSGTAAGSGGSVIFGNGQGRNLGKIGFAAIKGLLNDGGNNTAGDMAFSTRSASTDTALTERMRIAQDGSVTIVSGTNILSGGSASGYVYTNNDEFNFYKATNGAATGYINYHGYNTGSTQFRSLSIRDGKTNEIALFSGAATPAVILRGTLENVAGTTLDSTLSVLGNTTLGDATSDALAINGSIVLDNVTNAAATAVINATGYNGGTTQFRSIQIDTGKGVQFALFDGSKSSLEVDGNIMSGATAGLVYIGDNGVSCLWNTNASGSCEFNNVGFSNGSTQFRNFRVRDGKGTQAFFINAANATQYIEHDYPVTGAGAIGAKGSQLQTPEGITGFNGYAAHHLEWNDDWLNVFATTTAPTAQYIAGEYQIQSAGSTMQIIPVAAVTARPGVIALAKGASSTATDYTAIVSDPNGVNFGDGDWSFNWVGGVSATSSSSASVASAYVAEIGFLDTPSSIDQVDGCYFVYDKANAIAGGGNATNLDKLECVCASNSVRTVFKMDGTVVSNETFTTVDAPVAAVTFPNTNILNLKVKMTGTTRAEFYVGGVKSCDINTNIPSGSARLTGFGFLIHNEATTGTGDKELYTDFTSAQVDLTTARSP